MECDDYEATGFVQDDVHNSMEEQEDWKERVFTFCYCFQNFVQLNFWDGSKLLKDP